jgi:hypothetical protein
MNTYAKFCPNVFLAKCEEQYTQGDIILVTTKYGKENECIVFNFIAEKNGYFYYSIVRADGFNFAQNRAERLKKAASNSEKKSNEYYHASNEGADFLALGEPIKVGHYSEKRHRALIERNHNRMGKCVEFDKKANEQLERAKYWELKANEINLSMPESLEFYEFQLEKAKSKHEGLKNGTIPKQHSFSLTYAKKEVNEITKKLEIAKKLWQ